MSELAGTLLAALALVVRSKNAGPTMLTLDLFFRDSEGFSRAAASAKLTADAVAQLYGLNPGQVQRHLLPDIRAIKFSLPRSICAGTPGDGDVYGSQQHAPLLGIML